MFDDHDRWQKWNLVLCQWSVKCQFNNKIAHCRMWSSLTIIVCVISEDAIV